MKRIITVCAAMTALVSCATLRHSANSANSGLNSFPTIDQQGKVAIAAHRGFWKNEEAKDSQNSIASIRLAQENGFWGTEFDIHLTLDGEIIVNHDNSISGLDITANKYKDLCNHLLPNGEKRPTLDEYLVQGAKYPKTVLIVELKSQGSDALDEALVQKTLKTLKKHKLYDPSKVAFISFSYYTCKRVAELAPEFVNQYLNGDKTPAELAADGINGIDYNYGALYAHPEWIKEAHDLGMSVNVWTIDKKKDMKHFIELGVDAITTNEPLLLRSILNEKEHVL